MATSLWEPDFDRVLTVLRLEGEPDRVPFFELFHDLPILEAVLGRPAPGEPDLWRAFRIEFMTRLGYDYVVGYHTFGFPGVDALIAADTAGGEQNRGQRGWQDEHRGPIQGWESFEKYPWPVATDAMFEDIEKLAAVLPEGMKVTVTLPGGVLENLSRLFGYEPLCMFLADDPDLVQAVVDKIGEGELSVYKHLCAFEHVGLCWLNDDMGFKTQTMISPAALRRYVFPWQKKLVAYAHAHGKLVVLHACGNLKEVMEDLIEDVGIDAKHSFEDIIQPVAEFKRQYGGRVAACGGVDLCVLAGGTEAEVRAYTRRVIEDCAPGGGWTLGSGNSVANYVPLGNFLAMLEEGRACGVYTSGF
jgi:uroporphyrinogen decarboxylase